jgi:hypothetical protein
VFFYAIPARRSRFAPQERFRMSPSSIRRASATFRVTRRAIPEPAGAGGVPPRICRGPRVRLVLRDRHVARVIIEMQRDFTVGNLHHDVVGDLDSHPVAIVPHRDLAPGQRQMELLGLA